MRVTRLLAPVAAAAGSVFNFQIQKGHVNGLLIVKGFEHANDMLTIQRHGSSRTHVLCASLRLSEFRGIQELEYGYGNFTSAYINRAFDNAGMTGASMDGNVDAILGLEANVPVYYVDMGSIYANSGRVDITLQLDAAHSGTIAAYGVSFDRRPDFMRQYSISGDFDQTVLGVDGVYLSRNGGLPLSLVDHAGATLTVPDLNIQVEDGDETFLSDWLGAFAASNVLGKVEGIAVQRVIKVYDKPDAVPRDVYIRLSGAAATSDYRLIVCRTVIDQPILSANTLAEASAARLRLSRFEQRDPLTAKGMRHAGLIPHSVEVAAAEAAVRSSSV
jgi:hypothetical protein